MKNQIRKSLVYLGIIFSVTLFSNISLANTETHFSTLKNDLLMTDFNQFSWTTDPGAVSYKVTITDTATQKTSVINTLSNSISLAGMASGSYSVVVTAMYADGSSSIIIEDLIAI